MFIQKCGRPVCHGFPARPCLPGKGAPWSMMCGSFLLQRVYCWAVYRLRRNSKRPGGIRRGLATPAGAPESTESPCQPKPAGSPGPPAVRILPRLPLQVFPFGKNRLISFILKRPFTKRLILSISFWYFSTENIGFSVIKIPKVNIRNPIFGIHHEKNRRITAVFTNNSHSPDNFWFLIEFSSVCRCR